MRSVRSSLFSLLLIGAGSFTGNAFAMSFNRIDVDGPVDVRIQSARESSVPIADRVTTHVSRHTLYVDAPAGTGFWRRPNVLVRLPDLKGLVLNGSASVTGQVPSSGLNIKAYGTGSVKLLGMIPVQHIEQFGSSHLYLRWVNSDTLSIDNQGNGVIYLGGVARQVYARVADQAVLNATYLRAQKVQVQTTNQAKAYVYPVRTLRAFASDSSTVYYYRYPEHLTRYSEDSGNILQMAWRP